MLSFFHNLCAKASAPTVLLLGSARGWAPAQGRQPGEDGRGRKRAPRRTTGTLKSACGRHPEEGCASRQPVPAPRTPQRKNRTHTSHCSRGETQACPVSDIHRDSHFGDSQDQGPTCPLPRSEDESGQESVKQLLPGAWRRQGCRQERERSLGRGSAAGLEMKGEPLSGARGNQGWQCCIRGPEMERTRSQVSSPLRAPGCSTATSQALE